MPKVQDLFKQMLRDEIAPGLRDLGMRGSGRNFTLPDPAVFRLLGFQGHPYNQTWRAEFTVNLGVIDRAEYETFRTAGWPTAPTATLQVSAGEYTRLGTLMHDPGDRWWELTLETDTASLAAEIVESVREYGLPWLRRAPTWRTAKVRS